MTEMEFGAYSERVTADNSQPREVPNSTASENASNAIPAYIPPLLSLPSELLYQIFSYLSATDLASVSGTCEYLREHAKSEQLWASLVNTNLPTPLAEPTPFDSYRSLYIAHHPLWFLVRQKIWFSDIKNTGKIILVRYNAVRGRIEGYRIVARLLFRHLQPWPKNPSVLINSFDPAVSLWLDDPVIMLERGAASQLKSDAGWQRAAIRMPMDLESQNVFSSLIFCKKMPVEETRDMSKRVWPPRLIPAEERVDVTYSEDDLFGFPNLFLRPGEISESGFRLRRWLQFPNITAAFNMVDGISTFATLNPELYTPTKKKPYQGIWVGDYSGHGCEFLMITQQPGCRSLSAQDAEMNGEAEEASSSSHQMHGSTQCGSDYVPHGGLTAIKLTGDPNIPRGEVTFMADEIGPHGTIRFADEEIFRGARVVHSYGHIAGTNFMRGED